MWEWATREKWLHDYFVYENDTKHKIRLDKIAEAAEAKIKWKKKNIEFTSRYYTDVAMQRECREAFGIGTPVQCRVESRWAKADRNENEAFSQQPSSQHAPDE